MQYEKEHADTRINGYVLAVENYVEHYEKVAAKKPTKKHLTERFGDWWKVAEDAGERFTCDWKWDEKATPAEGVCELPRKLKMQIKAMTHTYRRDDKEKKITCYHFTSDDQSKGCISCGTWTNEEVAFVISKHRAIHELVRAYNKLNGTKHRADYINEEGDE